MRAIYSPPVTSRPDRLALAEWIIADHQPCRWLWWFSRCRCCGGRSPCPELRWALAEVAR